MKSKYSARQAARAMSAFTGLSSDHTFGMSHK